MKKLIMLYLILVVTIFSNVQAQEYFKYYQGEKNVYDISNDKIIIQFKSKYDQNLRERLLLENKLAKSITNLSEINGLSIVNLQTATYEKIKEYLLQLEQDTSILYVSPVLLNGAGKETRRIHKPAPHY